MDDILMAYARPTWWDHAQFIRDFTRSDCYWPPLKLEDAREATFLETTFELSSDGTLAYWLKNDNTHDKRIWRYQHFRSHGPIAQKRALLVACLRKVHKFASDAQQLYNSAKAKLDEFIQLHYPAWLINKACAHLAYTTGEKTWLRVRDSL